MSTAWKKSIRDLTISRRRCRDYSHIRKINVHWPVEVPRPVQTVVGPQRSVTLVFLFRQRRAARPEESSRDVHYHRESWTRLCTGTEELVPFPLPFLSVQLKLEAEGHPKVALDFNQTKMVSISQHHKSKRLHSCNSFQPPN